MRKKKWAKPMLIVLVRGRLEEAALTGCKDVSSGWSQDGANSACYWSGGMSCVDGCETLSAS